MPNSKGPNMVISIGSRKCMAGARVIGRHGLRSGFRTGLGGDGGHFGQLIAALIWVMFILPVQADPVLRPRPKFSVENHRGAVACVLFAPDGKVLASWEVIETKFWDVSSARELATVDAGYPLAFSPTGRSVAMTKKRDEKRELILVFDMPPKKAKASLKGHEGAITMLAFSPDGRMIASGSRDRTIRLWSLTTGEQRACLKHTGVIRDLVFSADGKLLASGEGASTTEEELDRKDYPIRLWNIATGKQKAIIRGHTGPVEKTFFSPDSKTLFTASSDKTVRAWDTATGRERWAAKVVALQSPIVAASSDGKVLAAARKDGSILLLATSTGKQLVELKGHKDLVTCLTFSSDGRILASASEDGTAILWETKTGKLKAVLQGHKDVAWIAISPDNKLIATCGFYDGALKLWDLTFGMWDEHQKR